MQNHFCNISKEDQRADLLRAVDLIIWDEVLMQSRFAHEALDRTMRDICDDDERPFGGKTVVFGGDFQQTLRSFLEELGRRSFLYPYHVLTSGKPFKSLPSLSI